MNETVPTDSTGSKPGDRARRVWLGLWLVAALFLVVRTGVRDRGVIYDHVEFGRRFVAGERLYEPYLEPPRPLHPVYPPSFGILTAPFAALGEQPARWAWGLTQVVALSGIGWVLVWTLRRARSGDGARGSPAGPILLLTFWLCGRYILRDTHGGGGNLINLALALGAWQRAEVGRPIQAGLLLGTSLATKPTTVLFVPFLAMCGRWRAAAAALLTGLGYALASLMMNVHAPSDWLRWLRGSLAYGARADLYAPPAYGFPPFTWMNQSLRPALTRYVGEVPREQSNEVEGPWFDGLGLDGDTVTWIYRAVATVLVVGTFAWCYKHRGRREGRFVGFALVAGLSLLLSPLSWKAHHVALIPAAFLLARSALHGPGRIAAIAFAVVYSFACLLGEEIVGKDFKTVQQSLYLTTFGTLAFGCWILLAGRRTLEHEGSQSPASPTQAGPAEVEPTP